MRPLHGAEVTGPPPPQACRRTTLRSPAIPARRHLLPRSTATPTIRPASPHSSCSRRSPSIPTSRSRARSPANRLFTRPANRSRAQASRLLTHPASPSRSPLSQARPIRFNRDTSSSNYSSKLSSSSSLKGNPSNNRPMLSSAARRNSSAAPRHRRLLRSSSSISRTCNRANTSSRECRSPTRLTYPDRSPTRRPARAYRSVPRQAARSLPRWAATPPRVPARPGSNQAIDLIRNILTTPRPGGLPGAAAAASVGLGSGIAGVASKIDAEGIKVYAERTNYKEWEFIYDQSQDKSAQLSAQGQAQQGQGLQGQGQGQQRQGQGQPNPTGFGGLGGAGQGQVGQQPVQSQPATAPSFIGGPIPAPAPGRKQ